ncbi:MAG: STAS domain-containing protein [Halocynthiibacter sp.]
MTVAKVKLRPRLGLGEAEPLVKLLGKHTGKDLTVDASAVTHLGTLCLQALIAAARDHAKTGNSFCLVNVNDTCVEQLALFGLSPEAVSGGAP